MTAEGTCDDHGVTVDHAMPSRLRAVRELALHPHIIVTDDIEVVVVVVLSLVRSLETRFAPSAMLPLLLPIAYLTITLLTVPAISQRITCRERTYTFVIVLMVL